MQGNARTVKTHFIAKTDRRPIVGIGVMETTIVGITAMKSLQFVQAINKRALIRSQIR